jgi:hypothetical protein
MECPKCLEENKRSIEENGYGYGYIGKSYDCQRHNPQKQNNATLKWTDGQPYERSRRLKHLQEMENKEFSENSLEDLSLSGKLSTKQLVELLILASDVDLDD